MLNGIKKGKAGEREAADWLYSQFNLGEKPVRNLEQTRSGGHDLLGFQPFCFEVKRQEILSKRTWWIQTVHSLTSEYPVPVVMYRQNRKKWKFLIGANHIGLKAGFIELEAVEFIRWAKLTLFGSEIG